MEIISKNTECIHKEIDNLLKIIEHGKIKDQIAALASLESILLTSAYIDKTVLNFDIKILGKPALLQTHAKKSIHAYKEFLNNFNEQKKFHQEYLSEILSIIGTELNNIDQDYRSNGYSHLEEDECLEIMLEYLKSIKKDNLLLKLIEEKRIFLLKDNIDKNNGEAVHMINNGNGFIFLENFSNNILSMDTLIHELGHIDDFITMDKKYSINDRYKVHYLSTYNEVNSKKLEKDFLHFLIDNNILKEEAKDLLIDLYWNDYDKILSTYILSFLPKNILYKNNYNSLTPKEITNMLPNQLNTIEKYIDDLNLSLQDDISYCYGAIISEFLKNDQEKNLFYDNYRGKIFDKRYIIEQDLSPNNFKQEYQKKLNKLK